MTTVPPNAGGSAPSSGLTRGAASNGAANRHRRHRTNAPVTANTAHLTGVAPSQAMTVPRRVSQRVAAEGYFRRPKSIRFTALSGITAMLSESGQKPT